MVSGGSKPWRLDGSSGVGMFSPPHAREAKMEQRQSFCGQEPGAEHPLAPGRPASSPELPTPTSVHPGSSEAGRAWRSFSDPKPFRKPFPSFPSESPGFSPFGNAVHGEMGAQQGPGHGDYSVFFFLFSRCLAGRCHIKERIPPGRPRAESRVRGLWGSLYPPSGTSS